MPVLSFLKSLLRVSYQSSWLVQVSAEIKQLEAKLSGSVKKMQLDNQMLDATQPVVLASASVAHAHSKTAQALTDADAPLIEFVIARSFANTLIKSSLGEQVSHTHPRQQPLSIAGLSNNHMSVLIP